jgi:hypothetical protein
VQVADLVQIASDTTYMTIFITQIVFVIMAIPFLFLRPRAMKV